MPMGCPGGVGGRLFLLYVNFTLKLNALLHCQYTLLFLLSLIQFESKIESEKGL
jgi:hypothetical protein